MLKESDREPTNNVLNAIPSLSSTIVEGAVRECYASTCIIPATYDYSKRRRSHKRCKWAKLKRRL